MKIVIILNLYDFRSLEHFLKNMSVLSPYIKVKGFQCSFVPHWLYYCMDKKLKYENITLKT